MKAILIDPHERVIRYVETSGRIDDKGGLPGMYSLIGCTLVDHRSLGFASDGIWFDDEGLFGDLDKQAFFALGSYPYPFAGRALIFGSDDEGNCTPPNVQLAMVERSILFLDNREGRRMYARAQRAMEELYANRPDVIVAGPSPEEVLHEDDRK